MDVVQKVLVWSRRRPERLAISDATGSLTYGELERSSRELSRALGDFGVHARDIVGVVAPRDKRVAAAILGIWRMGCTYVPLDPMWPEERIVAVLEDSGAGVVLSVQDSLPSGGCQPIGSASDMMVSRVARGRESNGDALIPNPLLAYVMYTSGSTGKPKGVQVTESNVDALMTTNEAWIPGHESAAGLCFHSFTFDVSVWELLRPLTRGAHVVVSEALSMMDPRQAVGLVQAWNIAQICMTPTAFRVFGAHVVRKQVDFPALRDVLLCGEKLQFSELKDWFAWFGDSRIRVWNVYGTTENTVYATAHRVTEPEVASESPRSIIGTSLGHVSVYVATPSPNSPGEIVISGKGVALGYRNLPSETEKRFLFEHSRRVYHTGDFGIQNTGDDIEFLSRQDTQVKLRGYRVELEEVESHLRQHQGVEECVVVIDDGHFSNPELVAGVVVRFDATLAVHELQRFLASRLPRYMVPRTIFQLDSLPSTTSGKLDRRTAQRTLDELFAAGNRPL